MERKRYSNLHHIHNWPQRAHEAGFSVSGLAKHCGVSVRTLERFFLAAFGDTPRHWLKRLRILKAVEFLRRGHTIKETAFQLGYLEPSHLSREFKRYYGVAPSKHASLPSKTTPVGEMSHLAMEL